MILCAVVACAHRVGTVGNVGALSVRRMANISTTRVLGDRPIDRSARPNPSREFESQSD